MRARASLFLVVGMPAIFALDVAVAASITELAITGVINTEITSGTPYNDDNDALPMPMQNDEFKVVIRYSDDGVLEDGFYRNFSTGSYSIEWQEGDIKHNYTIKQGDYATKFYINILSDHSLYFWLHNKIDNKKAKKPPFVSLYTYLASDGEPFFTENSPPEDIREGAVFEHTLMRFGVSLDSRYAWSGVHVWNSGRVATVNGVETIRGASGPPAPPTVTPLPGAVWTLLGAIGLLGMLRRWRA